MNRLFPVRFFGAARSWQAMLEVVACSLAYILIVVLLTPYLSGETLAVALLLLNPLCAIWCALRIRFIGGRRMIKALREIALPVLVQLAVILGVVLPVSFAGGAALDIWRRIQEGAPITSFYFSLLFVGPSYFILRLGVWFLRLWSRYQRRYMVLSLTNAILSTALIGGAIFMFFIAILGVFTNSSSANLGNESGLGIWIFANLQLLVSLFMGSFVSVFCLIAGLLPFAAVFSFWVARRTTKRLTELAGAADLMRQGRLDARVTVSGEDEVARLQAGFNSMASDLERTLRDLKTERDRVSGLLKSRKELIVDISHDLRTPVATLRAMLESEQKSGSPSAASAQTLATMDREIIRLQGLIDELFAVSQAEVDRLTIDPQPIQIGEVVRQRVEAAAPLAWQTGRVSVGADILPDLPPAVADRARLEQVLSNLLQNAIRHTPPGGLVVAGVSPEPDFLRIEVKDTGGGIEPEELPHIWDRYYRGRHEAEDNGAGIGLALVKEYTEAMGGTVAVKSEPGRGSVFTLFLPRA
ncbi:MAG: HAMP domain-containing histidine kinase [Anaerolineales bacterium]|nr:HAMP domain-containing histidine kinase [Anaerolineales bacterium]